MATVPLIVSFDSSQSQTTPSTFDSKQTVYQFDRYGWPICPTTGQSYTRQELIDNDTLPLPKDKLAKLFIENARMGIKPSPSKRKKAKRHTSGSRYTPRSFHAGQVLSRGRAMGEMVERVNQGEVENV